MTQSPILLILVYGKNCMMPNSDDWDYSGDISFEAQRNDIWTDNIQSFEMPF